jgi:hypothetical protein
MRRNTDWNGNSRTTYVQLGASNHSDKIRQREDFYATDPKAAEWLLKVEHFDNNIWECACGKKHLSGVFERHGYCVRSSDIIDRCGNEVYDFLSMGNNEWNGDIITNPPFSFAQEFIEKALMIIPKGNKVAMFLKLQFLEGKARKELYRIAPPKTVYVFSSRINCAMNGDFGSCTTTSAIAYAWYVWEKGFKGITSLKWIS